VNGLLIITDTSKHIWTYAAGTSNDLPSCPCVTLNDAANTVSGAEFQHFVRNHYYCEAGQNVPTNQMFTMG